MSRTTYLRIGVGALAFAAFLFLVAIPYAVVSPSNVRNVVLAPTFWPNIVAGLLALAGAAMVAASRRLDDAEHESFLGGVDGAALRLGLAAALMVGYVLAIPVLGMVWASMIAFVLLALLIKTRHPVAACVAAVVVPLALYLFFAHVAGVAIPQGALVRLP